MNQPVDYYFTPVSPWTYLGHARFRAMTSAAGIAIRYKPIDYGKVFPISGGLPLLKRAPQRQAYRLVELKRWSAHLDVPLQPQPAFFPVSPDLASRVLVAAERAGQEVDALLFAIMRAIWVEERDAADPATLAAVADAIGLDGPALIDAAASDAVKAAYEAHTQDAIAAEVFGAPTYIYRGEPFWGQDRLDFLERALQGG